MPAGMAGALMARQERRRRISGGKATAADRQRALDLRRREAGLRPLTVWVAPDVVVAIDDLRRGTEDRGAVVTRLVLGWMADDGPAMPHGRD